MRSCAPHPASATCTRAETAVSWAGFARTLAHGAAWHRQQPLARGMRRDPRAVFTAASAAASSRSAEATSNLKPLLCRHGDLAWGSCVSTRPSVSGAVAEAAAALQAAAGDVPFEPTLALVFASCNYGSQLQDVVRCVRRSVPSVRHVFGCSVGDGLSGSTHEDRLCGRSPARPPGACCPDSLSPPLPCTPLV